MAHLENKDFSPTGLKFEGQYENDRNADSSDLYKAIIRYVYGVKDVIIGHHMVYEASYKDAHGFTIQQVQEVPSADALIFDHDVAKKLWPKEYLRHLAHL